MILYHAISTYQLLEMILYRLKHSKKEESILMITDSLQDKYPLLDKYSAFFEDVWVYPINLEFSGKVSFQRVIDNFFNDYFKEKGIEILEFEELNVACAHYYFGHYLIGNEVPFVFFEDAAGMLSRADILINIEIERRPFKCKRNQERGLYDGTSETVKKVVCNVLAQEDVLSQYECVEDFNVIKELLNVAEEDKKKILDIFLPNELKKIADDTDVILTQHFANLKILDFEEQKQIYKLFIDYFFSGRKILLKPHPDDVMYYSKILQNVDVLKEKFPSEFLPLLLGDKAGEIATISSTAIKNYYGCNYNIFELNTDFEKTYQSIHRYYVALELSLLLGNEFATIGCDNTLLNALIQKNEELKGLRRVEESSINLIDDYLNLRFGEGKREYNGAFLNEIEEKINSLKNGAIIFLNSQEYYSFFNKNISVFENLIPVQITLEYPEKEWWNISDEAEEAKKQCLYVYTKNDSILNKVKEFSMKKKLENMGIQISVDVSKDYEKNIYEGKIKALEERLEYYMRLHEEVKDER